MFSASTFHALVSGRRRGLSASLVRGALRVAEAPYALAMRVRNHRYDSGRAEIHRVGVPVVSVGNITLGGTGKTPLVEWIARWLRQHGVRVALVSRGYGATDGSANDEALELEQKLPDVPHVQNRDRVAGARLAIEEFESQLVLLDDGFQHRRLARDLDIVVLDATEPFGCDHVFPRGLLREPLAGLRRADVFVLSRADLVTPERRAEIRQRAQGFAPHAAWVEARHAPRVWRSAGGLERPLEELAGRKVAAFCGIGNPESFRRTLMGAGCDVVVFREYPDHHAYNRADVDGLTAWARTAGTADAVVTTHKDLVKIGVEQLAGKPLWALVVGMEILADEAELIARLTALLPTSG
ncbi:MAG: tetraacyldisaccharide 4'-kinase [Pirellulales bacterium]|nr:tetraacyldisaccharide 4'-kinase [Pirellulales bacterium]